MSKPAYMNKSVIAVYGEFSMKGDHIAPEGEREGEGDVYCTGREFCCSNDPVHGSKNGHRSSADCGDWRDIGQLPSWFSSHEVTKIKQPVQVIVGNQTGNCEKPNYSSYSSRLETDPSLEVVTFGPGQEQDFMNLIGN